MVLNTLQITDDFIAKYQTNYNYQSTDDEIVQPEVPASASVSKAEKRKANDPCV